LGGGGSRGFNVEKLFFNFAALGMIMLDRYYRRV